MAGIIAAEKNGSQVTGVAYESKIVRISHRMYFSSTIASELASGINWAWESTSNGGAGVDVINCSWGDRDAYHNVHMELHSTVLEQAIVDAMTKGRGGKGCVVVFAAGNSGSLGAIVNYPANFHDNILVVGSIDQTGARSSFSGYGAGLDVVAPGGSIWSTIPQSSIDYMSGTSMAAPNVSGIAALMLSVTPSLSASQIEYIIKQTTSSIGWNNQIGSGLVDAYAAVMAATPTPVRIDVQVYNLTADDHTGMIMSVEGNVNGSYQILNSGELGVATPSYGESFYPGISFIATPGDVISNFRLTLSSEFILPRAWDVSFGFDSSGIGARNLSRYYEGYPVSSDYSNLVVPVNNSGIITMYMFLDNPYMRRIPLPDGTTTLVTEAEFEKLMRQNADGTYEPIKQAAE